MQAAVASPFNVQLSHPSPARMLHGWPWSSFAPDRFDEAVKRARHSCGHRFCAGEPSLVSRCRLV